MGIYSDSSLGANFTVQNVTATNRYSGFDLHGGGQDLTLLNNNLANNTIALYLDSFTDGADADTVPVIGSGNVVTNSADGFKTLEHESGLYLGTSGTGLIVNNASDGFDDVSGNALYLRNVPSSTIDGLDLSWTGSGPEPAWASSPTPPSARTSRSRTSPPRIATSDFSCRRAART